MTESRQVAEKDLILAVDNGTQSVRALLFDKFGSLLLKSRVPIEPYFSTAPGLAEQHPEVFWEAVCQACKELMVLIDQSEKEGISRQRIAGMSITTQRSTLINLDKQKKPLRPAIVWLDKRRTENLAPLGGPWGLIFRLSGMTRTVAYLQAEAEANWIQAHQPDIWEKTDKFIFLSGYLTYRLTSKLKDSVGCQVGYMPFDYKKLRWASPWDWKWRVLPVRRSQLVELTPPASLLGEITPEASESTGLPVGLPVVAAASDKACEVIGAGCLDPHIGCLSYGTTATINTTHKKYTEVIPLIPPYPAAIPGAYSLEIQIYRGFWMVSWFKQEFGHLEQRLAEQLGQEPEALFDQLVESVPPGSDGLVLQPYWSPGLKIPGPEAKGAVIGFGDVHTRAHLYKAILEGLAYALREGAERTTKRSGIPITELRIAGGGSQSKVAMQITADIFGLPTSRPHVYEASGLGTAIVASVGLGIHPNFDTALREMTRVRDTFHPITENQQIYEHLYNNIYLKMYDRLRPLYEELYKAAHQA